MDDRIDATLSSSTVRLGGLVREMLSETGLAIKGRNDLGTNYPACWVGSEAVDWLHNKKKLPRHEAENLLNRAMSFGLILHVTHEHRVKDGNYFYRFVEILRLSSRPSKSNRLLDRALARRCRAHKRLSARLPADPKYLRALNNRR
jgi:hypothetical protein